MPGLRLRAAAECLEHGDPGGRLLDVGGQVALLVLGPPGQHPVAPLEPAADQAHRQEDPAGDQAQPPVEVDQQRDDRDERDHVGDQEDRAEPGEAPDRRQVGSGTGQQLPGLPLVVEPDVQPLQVRVQVAAHGLFHAGNGAGLDPAPGEVQCCLRYAEPGRGEADGQHQAAVTGVDRAVDQGLGQQRDHQSGGDRSTRGCQHSDQSPQVGPQIAAEPPQRRHRCRRGMGTRVGSSVLGGHYRHANRRAAPMSSDFPPLAMAARSGGTCPVVTGSRC